MSCYRFLLVWSFHTRMVIAVSGASTIPYTTEANEQVVEQTCRAFVEHRKALDEIFFTWYKNGLILLRGAWNTQKMGPYACIFSRALDRIFFACVGTHFFVRFRPPWVKSDYFCATQKKSTGLLDGRSTIEHWTTCSLASVVYKNKEFRPVLDMNILWTKQRDEF